MKMPARFVLVLSLFLAGCTHVISEESMRLVDTRITFEELRKAPDAYVGKFVLLGGAIAGVKNSKKGAELEVVQTPLDNNDEPEETRYSGGRFLVTSSRFLDPLVYKSGRRVTVVGEVKGKKTRAIDEAEYLYPVVAEVEMRLWEKYEPEKYYPYPPPYYYYDPYWGPWGPRPYYPYWW